MLMVKAALVAAATATSLALSPVAPAEASPLLVVNFTPTINVYHIQIVNVKVKQSNDGSNQSNGNVNVNIGPRRLARH